MNACTNRALSFEATVMKSFPLLKKVTPHSFFGLDLRLIEERCLDGGVRNWRRVNKLLNITYLSRLTQSSVTHKNEDRSAGYQTGFIA